MTSFLAFGAVLALEFAPDGGFSTPIGRPESVATTLGFSSGRRHIVFAYAALHEIAPASIGAFEKNAPL